MSWDFVFFFNHNCISQGTTRTHSCCFVLSWRVLNEISIDRSERQHKWEAKRMFNWTHVTEANITFTTKIRKATLVEGTKQPQEQSRQWQCQKESSKNGSGFIDMFCVYKNNLHKYTPHTHKHTHTHAQNKERRKKTHTFPFIWTSISIIIGMKSRKNLLKSASHFEIFGVRERDARLIKFLCFVITWINVSSWGLRCGCGTCLWNLLIAVAPVVPSLSGHIWVHTYVCFHMHIKIGEPNCTKLSYLNCSITDRFCVERKHNSPAWRCCCMLAKPAKYS